MAPRRCALHAGEAGVSAEREPVLGVGPVQFGETQLPDGGPPLSTLSGPEADTNVSGVRLWWHRVSVLFFVFFCAVLGVILVVFPWRDEWTNNFVLNSYPTLQDFFGSGFVRGLCSGLGLLDIWIGFWEAVHYHE
jgi:hypothetical protein